MYKCGYFTLSLVDQIDLGCGQNKTDQIKIKVKCFVYYCKEIINLLMANQTVVFSCLLLLKK